MADVTAEALKVSLRSSVLMSMSGLWRYTQSRPQNWVHPPFWGDNLDEAVLFIIVDRRFLTMSIVCLKDIFLGHLLGQTDVVMGYFCDIILQTNG